VRCIRTRSVSLFEPTHTTHTLAERNEFLPRLRDSYVNSAKWNERPESAALVSRFSRELWPAFARHFATSRPSSIRHGNPQRLPIIPDDPRSDYASVASSSGVARALLARESRADPGRAVFVAMLTMQLVALNGAKVCGESSRECNRKTTRK